MKLQTLFLTTHAVVAAASGGLAFAALQLGSAPALAGAAVLSIVTLAAASWYTTSRIRSGLSAVQSAISDHESVSAQPSGIEEFERCAESIGQSAVRWETVAADTRQQAREFQAMITMLNRRGSGSQPSSGQLRDLLTGIGNTLHRQLTELQNGAAEVEQYTQTITEGAEEQRHVVIKTTSYVEQLSATIDAISDHTESAHSASQRNGQSAAEMQELIRGLLDGMNRVRAQAQTSEKKLRGLSDPSRQISSIVGTICDIAARTDLLALNASIESIRAGEHGRGFAIVADEVRKLAEQATDATREISQLVDAMQLVTQEAVGGIARQREQVDCEVQRAAQAEKIIRKIRGDSENSAEHLGQISRSANQQLQLAQDVVVAVEQISTIAKDHRGSAENACWAIKSLSNSTPQFSGPIDRLRNCGGTPAPENDHPADASNAAPAAPITVPATAPNMVPVA
ncbi:MAG: methyl-accepting chemotaxis protein [Pirellulales bacterium]|nr:methyl-accepting chemotaxis protein [Pirellulales bacterium]